jgi:urocanate hydratase
MLFFDVNNGIARRAWARNEHAMSTIVHELKKETLQVTFPYHVNDSILESL